MLQEIFIFVIVIFAICYLISKNFSKSNNKRQKEPAPKNPPKVPGTKPPPLHPASNGNYRHYESDVIQPRVYNAMQWSEHQTELQQEPVLSTIYPEAIRERRKPRQVKGL